MRSVIFCRIYGKNISFLFMNDVAALAVCTFGGNCLRYEFCFEPDDGKW
jgi:hypothetical protein